MKNLYKPIIIGIIMILTISLTISLYHSYKVVKERDRMIKEIITTFALDIEDLNSSLSDLLQYEDLLTDEKIDRSTLNQIYRELESIDVLSSFLTNNPNLSKEERIVIESIKRTSRNLRSFLAQASIEGTPFELNSCDGITIKSKEEILEELKGYVGVFNRVDRAKGNKASNGSSDFLEWYQYIIENWDTDNFSTCHVRVVEEN
ncbi:hypothetical protein [Halalkalibacter urbisdiaboli]|uniref:hypothetical protein n=1 Tax=Halalkalibacter urbisdiaboli TaxID=1960589 RepID=UPI000B450F64|nr:hypothetical protein [Halalkalibacter urbisdiaboli]